MIKSLNQFIKHFESFVEAHDQLNDFGYGSTSDIGRSKDMQFPYLWVTHSGASAIQLQNKTQLPNMSMTFIIVDQINDQANYEGVNGADSNNCQEVLSDTFQIQQDLLSYISNYLNKEGIKILDQGASIEPLMDETTDKVCGWVLNLTVQITHLNCAIPGDFTNVNPPPPQDCPSAMVQNSDTSYNVSVASGGTLILPDIDITLNSGVLLTLASVKNQDIELVDQDDTPIVPDSVIGNKITVTTGGVPCNSLKPTKSGQVTSYASNDDGAIQFGRDTDFFTLSWTNPFGDSNRFTDVDGLQVYGNAVVIDWTTYDAVLGEVTGYLTSSLNILDYPLGQNWNGWMANAPYTTADGLTTGFYLANWNQLMSVLNWQSASNLLNYAPFNYNLNSSGKRILHSTTPSITGNIIELTGTQFAYVAKTTSRQGLLYRQYTLSELGL